MKIGIFNPYLDDLGGGEKYMMTIAQCLSDKHDVTVFWDEKKDIEELMSRFSLDLSKVTLAQNIFSKNTPLLKRLLTTIKFDAIIILSDGSIPFVLSRKLFVHFQQPISDHVSSLKTKLKLSRVTTFFCNSYFTKSFIDKTFNIESQVVYPPVDLHRQKVKKENIILTVGRLRVKDVRVNNAPIGDYKKHMVMIEAFKEMIVQGLKDWRLVLAISIRQEEKDILQKMRTKAKDFPIEFVVNQNNQKLWNVYNITKIYWHAAGFGEDLENHPEYAEHFGIATVEAMGAGAVPVVINAGGQKEIVEEEKTGFLWNTLDQLQEKTRLLIKDNQLMQRLGKNAQEKAKQFSKERFYRQVYEIIT